MCEHCINYENDSDELPETTQEDIEFWKQNGKYFGYPQCCIDAFCNRVGVELTPEQNSVIDNHGFIPCQHHAIMILQKRTTLKELISNRECQYDYPMDDYDAELVKFIIDNDEELRQEFLDAGYISEEKEEI